MLSCQSKHSLVGSSAKTGKFLSRELHNNNNNNVSFSLNLQCICLLPHVLSFNESTGLLRSYVTNTMVHFGTGELNELKTSTFWVQNIKVPFGMGHLICTQDHKSSNKIQLS